MPLDYAQPSVTARRTPSRFWSVVTLSSSCGFAVFAAMEAWNVYRHIPNQHALNRVVFLFPPLVFVAAFATIKCPNIASRVKWGFLAVFLSCCFAAILVAVLGVPYCMFIGVDP